MLLAILLLVLCRSRSKSETFATPVESDARKDEPEPLAFARDAEYDVVCANRVCTCG